jgi:K+-transporting ATPase A subunit
VIGAVVLLAIALVAALAYISRGLLARRFARATAFETVVGARATIVPRPLALDFRAWLARFGSGFVS